MKCSYHEDREAVSKCKVCGADLCNICDDFKRRKGYCSRCSANFDGKNYQTFLGSFKSNLFSLICAILFLVLWLVCLIATEISITYIDCGGIIGLLMLGFSVYMLTISIVNLKKVKRDAKASFEKYIKNRENNAENSENN